MPPSKKVPDLSVTATIGSQLFSLPTNDSGERLHHEVTLDSEDRELFRLQDSASLIQNRLITEQSGTWLELQPTNSLSTYCKSAIDKLDCSTWRYRFTLGDTTRTSVIDADTGKRVTKGSYRIAGCVEIDLEDLTGAVDFTKDLAQKHRRLPKWSIRFKKNSIWSKDSLGYPDLSSTATRDRFTAVKVSRRPNAIYYSEAWTLGKPELSVKCESSDVNGPVLVYKRSNIEVVCILEVTPG